MKIYNNSNIKKIIGAYKSKTAEAQKSNKSNVAKDKIEISSNARDFLVAINAFKKLPGAREGKVLEIKQGIASGTYNPSSKEIIDKMYEGINFDKKI